jgi:DNA-binding response OmpR family regulator
MNGFDVCNWVKHKLGLEDVYIVMLTAKGQEFDRQKSIEVRADMYTNKPFYPDEILKKSQEVLGI